MGDLVMEKLEIMKHSFKKQRLTEGFRKWDI